MCEGFEEKMDQLDRKIEIVNFLHVELVNRIARLDAMLQESKRLIISTKDSNSKVIESIFGLQEEMDRLNNQFDEIDTEEAINELVEDEDDEYGLFSSSE